MGLVRVLGVDCALSGPTGVALLEAEDICQPENGRVVLSAVIAGSHSRDRQRQLVVLSQAMSEWLDGVLAQGLRLDYAFVEEPGAWPRGEPRANLKGIVALGQARAAIMLALAARDIPAEEIDVNSARLAIGVPNLPKKLGAAPVKERVSDRLHAMGLWNGPEGDECDAVCVAVAGMDRMWQAEKERRLRTREKASKRARSTVRHG